MELTTAALAAKLCGVEADDELLGVLCAAAEQAWKNRLQSGVTPADCGSALPRAAAVSAAAGHPGQRSRGGGDRALTGARVSVARRVGGAARGRVPGGLLHGPPLGLGGCEGEQGTERLQGAGGKHRGGEQAGPGGRQKGPAGG